jgi:hypothetical protein
MGLALALGGALIVVAVVAAASFAIRAGQRRFAASLPPTTLTAAGVRDKDLMTSLVRAQNGGMAPSRVPLSFLVTFSSEAVTFYSGGRNPSVLATISADRVLNIDLGTHTENPEYRQPVLPRVKVTVAVADNSSVPAVDIQFAASNLTTGGPFGRNLDEPSMQDLVMRAREALKGGNPAAVTPPPSTLSFTPRPGTLEPGTSAYRAAHVGSIPVTRIITGIWIVASVLVLGAALMRDVGLLVGIVVVQVLTIGALLWRQNRAEARETAAGYTTLNGRNLTLEQRHPESGMVIREAGGTAISKERFRELLGR